MNPRIRKDSNILVTEGQYIGYCGKILEVIGTEMLLISPPIVVTVYRIHLYKTGEEVFLTSKQVMYWKYCLDTGIK